jgi:transcriptional regulator with XRE-family HTH domain
MNNLSDEEIKRAFDIWRLRYYPQENEEFLEPFLAKNIRSSSDLSMGWLKKARNGLFLSAQSVADKMKVSRAAYSKYEECEELGSITLGTLAKAAEAMDCELVYAIRPKSKKLFSEIIWEKLLQTVKLHPFLKTCDQKRRGAVLGEIAFKYMTDTQFRKKQNWSQHKK